MSFRNFTTCKSHAFGGEYIELVPGERLRYTDKFDDPNLPGETQVTVTLKKYRSAPSWILRRQACRTSFHLRLVISVGRIRCETWQGSSSPRSINSASDLTGTRWNGPKFFGMRDKSSKEARS